ncbi:MAG: hypothetical protein KKG60_02580 [Nanoarchaeota archaeon]|nr:hypothetical protein [Nanoarchaeota archaeon]
MSLFNKKEENNKKNSALREDMMAPPMPMHSEEIRKKSAEQSLNFPRYSPVNLSDTGESEDPFEEMMKEPEPITLKDEKPFSSSSEDVHTKGQSLFVKIEKYNGLIDLVTEVKKKLNHADHILKELENIRKEEERELRSWQGDISSIKARLVEIDEQLFRTSE